MCCSQNPKNTANVTLFLTVLQTYRRLWEADRDARDEPNTVSNLPVPPRLLTMLEEMVFRAEAYWGLCSTEEEEKDYRQTWLEVTGILFAHKRGVPKYGVAGGKASIDREIALHGYAPWWVCEVQHPMNRLRGGSGGDKQCEKVPRGQLRCCARVRLPPCPLVQADASS